MSAYERGDFPGGPWLARRILFAVVVGLALAWLLTFGMAKLIALGCGA
jgi:hypothetical protein